MRFILKAACTLLFGTQVCIAWAQGPAGSSVGDWRGSLSVGAIKLRIALHLGATSTLDSPDQGVVGMPVHATINGQHVVVTTSGAGEFEGDVAADGQSLDVVLRQGASTIPVHFERGVFVAANRPQTPRPPFPYRREEVGYDNPRAPGVHLAGTLTTPSRDGPFPAVLLFTGSGTQDRDETLFEHKPFLVLADALTRRGIAARSPTTKAR